MIEQQNTIIVIPVRMASRGLPGKPMADIRGIPLIIHAWQQAVASKLGTVLVAASENELAEVVRRAGGDAIVAPANLNSQLDRVAAVLKFRDEAQQFKQVVILSADMPFIDAHAIRRCLGGLTNEQVDLATLAAPISDENQLNDLRVVKVIAGLSDDREVAYARDFRRTVQQEQTPPYWQHVGVIALRRAALERIAATPPSTNENARALEMMRPLDIGMRIAAVRIDEAPLRVDSPAALEHARQLFKAR